MPLKEYLTNEQVSKKFPSHFSLVNYAIRLAKNRIHAGRECFVETPIQNLAYQVLLEISEGKDQFEELVECREEEAAGEGLA